MIVYIVVQCIMVFGFEYRDSYTGGLDMLNCFPSNDVGEVW